MRPLLAALALLVSMPAAAQNGWQDDGTGRAPEGSQAARDGFGAMVMVTDDRDAFVQAWEGPTPPTLSTTARAERNRPVYAMIIFYGCAAGPDGNCNVTAEFTTMRPDGRPDGETVAGEIWRDPPMPGQALQLGRALAAVNVRPEDPSGVWRMQVQVTDHVRGMTLHVEGRVTVDSPPVPASS